MIRVDDQPNHANPDLPCPHNDFDAYVAVNRITASDDGPVIGYSAEVTIQCRCGEPFRFTGVPAGLSPTHPTVSPDEATLRAPIRPASADPDFGLGIPGFAINYRPGVTPDGGRRG